MDSIFDAPTYTTDSRDASKDETPATIIVACVSFCPVPPESAPIVAVASASVPQGYDAFKVSLLGWISVSLEISFITLRPKSP